MEVMWMRWFIKALVCSWASCAAAQESVWADAENGWRAIAVIERAGKPHCRATLVSRDMALTAAHCIQDPHGDGPIAAGEMVFPGGARLVWSNAAVVPGFRYESYESAPLSVLHQDVAVLRLEGVAPSPAINVNRLEPGPGAQVVLEAGDGRWEVCPTRAIEGSDDLFWVGCDRRPGFSGSPVLWVDGGRLHTVGVVLAQSDTGGLFAHRIEPILPQLYWADALERKTSP
jgi:hypothetical protein